MLHKNKGFTLVELLIVIAIIGILAGVILSVINPQKQRNRATQTAQRSYTAKLCQAIMACISASTSGTCPTAGEVNNTAPTNVNVFALPANVTAANSIGPVGNTLNTCTYTCALATGAITQGGTCD